jgi:hypothetical protein
MRLALSTLFCVYVCIDRAWLFPSSFIPLPICYSSSLYNSISCTNTRWKGFWGIMFSFLSIMILSLSFLVLFYHTAYRYPSILHIWVSDETRVLRTPIIHEYKLWAACFSHSLVIYYLFWRCVIVSIKFTKYSLPLSFALNHTLAWNSSVK